MKKLFLSSAFLLVVFFAFCQSDGKKDRGVVLAVEGERVFLDLNHNDVAIGTRLQVLSQQGFFIHPATGEKIMREPDLIAMVEIIDVRANYSVGLSSNRNSLSQIKPGMEAVIVESSESSDRFFRESVTVQSINTPSAQGAYLGFYMADILTQELFKLDKFRVIDRQFGQQMDEAAMNRFRYMDESEAITLSRSGGADYLITATFYEPEVVEVSSGVPIKGIVSAAEAISGRRLGSELVSDVRITQIHAIVHITLRVIDTENGEIIFFADEMQQATGRGQVNLEQGVLSGLQIQGGSTSFQNTITGQAAKAALTNLAGYVNDYFDGEIDVRNFEGNTINVARVGSRSERRNQNSSEGRALIISAEPKTRREEVSEFEIIIDKGRSSGFRRNRFYSLYEPSFERSRITGEIDQEEVKKIGTVYFTEIEENNAKGILELRPGTKRDRNEKFENAWVGR